jgi:hypothetical protein
MHDQKKTDLITREDILMLLSDDEVASVSHLEATAGLLDGEEYLDLDDLPQGVRNDFRASATPMGRVLPRRAVQPATWNKIKEQLASLHAPAARTDGSGPTPAT